MKRLNISAPVFLQRAKDHESIQQQMLDIINSDEIRGSKSFRESIKNTDYYLANRFKEPKSTAYWNLLFPSVEEHFNNIIQITGDARWRVNAYWFQTYDCNDFHALHAHPDCMYSSVYYLTLPKGSFSTTFRCFGEEFEFDIQEGDILTFPGFVKHESKPNRSNSPKNIVAFNSNLE
jgi:hypothetical protein